MTPARQDKFVGSLKKLLEQYPEYSRILQLLIEQIQQGKAVRVQAKLKQLQDEEW